VSPEEAPSEDSWKAPGTLWKAPGTGSKAGGSKAGRWPGWVLLVVVAVAFGLRLWHGSVALDAGRYYDELFSFRNVSAVLVEGVSKPANAFYPSLSYWPQTAVLAVSGWLHDLTDQPVWAVRGESGDGWTPTAYFLVRAVCALFGALSVGLVFLLGRRLFDARVGLVAAALTAALPPHLFASAIFKPDILVVLLVVLTFLWSLSAVERPSYGRFALAGVGVGLAVCAKYTGVGGALPLIAGALAYGGWRDGRRWGQLLVAGLASILTFVLLNPYLFVVIRYIPRLLRIAEEKATYHKSTPWTVAGRELRFLSEHHGWPVFALAVLGLLGFAWLAWGSPRWRSRAVLATWDGPVWRPGGMILAYVLGYSLLYALAGGVFRGQNYIPVGVFTALAAAWVGVSAWDQAARRFPAWAGRSAPVALALVLGWATWQPLEDTYVETVPTTMARVERELAARMPELALRHVYFERGETPMWPKARANPMVALPVPSLAEVAPETLDWADAEVFFGERASGPQAALYRERRARAGVEEVAVRAKLLAVRGPELVILLHPWRLLGEPEPLALTAEPRRNRFTASLARPLEPTELASLGFWLPIVRGEPRPSTLWLGERRIPIFETANRGKRSRFLTERFALPAGSTELSVGFERKIELPGPPEVVLHRWAPSSSAPTPPP
jgi:4-amino-4-deoxy-L-arabinose transferase-like glycosyltransferase